MLAYVGCRTTKYRNALGKGIVIYDIQANSWTEKQIISVLDNPSYLCFDCTKQFLYTVHGDCNDVSAFSIQEDGTLVHLNTVRAEGINPVYITPSVNNNFLFCATLQGGTVVSLPIRADGSLGAAVCISHLPGLTDDSVSHAHQCELDRTGQWLLVPTQGRHVGYERVYILKVDNETGELVQHSHVEARTYAEPRHLVISKDNKRVYLINEKGNFITYYRFDEQEGILESRQIIPSLPETYTSQGQASAILLSPNEKFVYATNRLHDSIVTYRVNEETGFLTTLSFDSALGITPRFATFSPNGTQLLVANEESHTIRIFEVNQDTGRLTFSGTTIETGSPTSIVFK